jgi:anti-anti-sigma factor
MPRVLLIEDSAFQAAQFTMMLQSVGFDVETADTLANGVARVQQGGIDTILLDLNLPDSLGLSTFESAVTKVGNTPIVVLTHVDDEELAATTLQRGAQDYLVKGEVNTNWLKRSIQNAISRSRPEVAPAATPEVRPAKARPLTLVDIETTDDIVIARINERQLLDARVNTELSEQLVRRITHGCRKMVIDFAAVEYMSNAALGALLVLRRRMQAQEGRLYLCALRDSVSEQLSARQFHRLFEIFTDADSAVASLKASSS